MESLIMTLPCSRSTKRTSLLIHQAACSTSVSTLVSQPKHSLLVEALEKSLICHHSNHSLSPARPLAMDSRPNHLTHTHTTSHHSTRANTCNKLSIIYICYNFLFCYGASRVVLLVNMVVTAQCHTCVKRSDRLLSSCLCARVLAENAPPPSRG